MNDLDCALILRDEVAERYLRHELNDAEQSAYEQHFFECPHCAQELSQLQAVRHVLEADPRLRLESRPPPLARWRPMWNWLATAAIAASVIGVAMLIRDPVKREQIVSDQGDARGPTPSVQVPAASAPSPQPAPQARAPSASTTSRPEATARPVKDPATLRKLARFEPPDYRPIVLRGVTDEASTRFRDAMVAYSAGDYRTAVDGLAIAAELDPSRPDISFFHGVSSLLAGDVATGASELERTIGLGDSAFLGEAHFYLAKAHLALGELDRARDELRRAAAMDGAQQESAAALLTQLQDMPPS